MWEVVATQAFEQWLGQQSAPTQDAVRFTVRLLMQLGPRLSRPHADTLAGSKYSNMKELRVSANRAAIRIAFVFDPHRRAVLLIAGDKRGVNQKRFYRQLIAQADALYSEYLKR